MTGVLGHVTDWGSACRRHEKVEKAQLENAFSESHRQLWSMNCIIEMVLP